MIKKKSFLMSLTLVCVLAVNIIFFTACGKKDETQQSVTENQVIKIGVILPLTGNFASLGNWFEVGYKIAEDEINLVNPNRKIKIIIEDGKSNVNESIMAYRKLVEIEGVKIIGTTLSPICLALKPLAIKDKVLLFANSAHPGVTEESSPYIFRHSNTANQEGALIVDYIKNSLNSSSGNHLYVLYLNNEFGLGYKDFVSHYFGEKNLDTESYEVNQIDFADIVSKIINKKPEVVLIIGFTKNMGILIKSLRNFKFEGTIFANFGFTTPDILDAAGDAADKVLYIDYAFPMDSPQIINIRKKVSEKFKSELAPVGLLSYDVINLIWTAINSAESLDNLKLSEFIHNKKNFDFNGIKISVNIKGDILPPLKVLKYNK